METRMKKVVIAALAATTALTGVMSAGVAAAQPGYYGDRDRDHDRDRDRHDDGRYDRRHDRGEDRRDGRVYERQWGNWYSHDRWSRGDHRFYGGRHGYNGYRGHWRTGQ